MALPWEKNSVFPEAYRTKVPERVQRREKNLPETHIPKEQFFSETSLGITPRLIAHEDETYYFDYGAVRLGRTPTLEDPRMGDLTCVGLGWLPGWAFTINERGLPDVLPVRTGTSSSKLGRSDDGVGVLGLLYQLLKSDQAAALPKKSMFSRKKRPDVKELPFARGRDWTAAVPFHPKHKVPKMVRVYVHLFDGGLGHEYQKDGKVVPFRTPDWPVRAVVHVDPDKPRVSKEEPKLKVVTKPLQGEWVARELGRWAREARLPQDYVDEVMDDYVCTDSNVKITAQSARGLARFLGFKVS